VLAKFLQGLKKTKDSIASIWTKLDYNELEEALILADVNFETVDKIIAELKQKNIKDMDLAKAELRNILCGLLEVDAPQTNAKIKIFIGVNGVGKTTTLSKLASKYKQNGKNVLLVAGDTFRAAATEQLSLWAQRLNIPIIKQSEGADSASVLFDAIEYAKAKGNIDYILVDTAGRMHNKANLLGELEKIIRIAKKYEEPEVYLVLDSLTGQNALSQAKGFTEITDISGIILTKLDSTAKGGIAISLADELAIPIKYIGVGETTDDLLPFDAREFVEAII